MTLHERLAADMKEAMRAKDATRLQTLRFLLAVLHNKEIEKRSKGADAHLSEEEVRVALQGEAKKRREAAALFARGGRADLAQREKAELTILDAYLPQPMGEKEVRSAVESVVARTQTREFGPAMKEAMKELRGKADAATVAAAVKEILGR